MKVNEKIYVAGHNGMVGSAILRKLEEQGQTNFITRSKIDYNEGICRRPK